MRILLFVILLFVVGKSYCEAHDGKTDGSNINKNMFQKELIPPKNTFF